MSKPFNQELYEKLIDSCKEIDEFNDNPCTATAMELSIEMFDAVQDSIDHSQNVGIFLNSSTGKDSTCTVGLFWRNATSRMEAGKPVAPAIVCIADTAAEFPEMRERMHTEAEALNAHAMKTGMDLRAYIVEPDPHDRILVQLIGNGIMLPTLRNVTKGEGGAGNWCMDRVKRKPLEKVKQIAGDNFDFYVQVAGVRSAESAKRSLTIKKYNEGMPFGLTDFSDAGDNVIGFIPIVHWTDKHIRDWMDLADLPWNWMSGEDLRRIYEKAADPVKKGEVGQCSLVAVKDGFATICSDLSGARYGCWMCLKSKNKSMKNVAERDPRYKWLRVVDRFIKFQHRNGRRLAKYRDKYGFDRDTMFPKGFTLKWRLDLLLLIFRAELESGFTLLFEDDLQAIRMYWRKHGLYTIDPEWIRQDAKTWKDTGKVTRRWEEPCMQDLEGLNRQFSEGIQLAAYFNVIHPEMKTHHKPICNLLPYLGYGTPLLPKLLTYVFRDPRNSERIIHLVSDNPCALFGSANKTLLNGISPMVWVFQGAREPTDWEKTVSNGRILYYVLDRNELKQSIEDNYKEIWGWDRPPTEGEIIPGPRKNIAIKEFHWPVERAYMRSMEMIIEGGRRSDCMLADQHLRDCELEDLTMTTGDFQKAYTLVWKMIGIGEWLVDKSYDMKSKIVDRVGDRGDWLDFYTEQGKTSQANSWRKRLRKWIVDNIDLTETYDATKAYISAQHRIIRLIMQKRINAAVIYEMAEIARMQILAEETYDNRWRKEYTRLRDKVTRRPQIQPPQLMAIY